MVELKQIDEFPKKERFQGHIRSIGLDPSVLGLGITQSQLIGPESFHEGPQEFYPSMLR